MVILEEAAHMDKKVFFEVVVPLLGVKHTAVLAISTPDDEFNYYTQLLELGLFKVIKIGLTCEACEAMGLACTHKIRRLPHWKTMSKSNNSIIIYYKMDFWSAFELRHKNEVYLDTAFDLAPVIYHLIECMPRTLTQIIGEYAEDSVYFTEYNFQITIYVKNINSFTIDYLCSDKKGRQQMIQRVMASDPELMVRETRGLVMSTKQFMIHKSFILQFHTRAPYQIKNKVQVLHMAIDPSGGGTASDYAVCTIGREAGKTYIASLEVSNSNKNNAIVAMLQNHVLMLRKIPEYRNAIIFLYIESNMSFLSADGVCEMFISDAERFGPMIPVSDRKQDDGRYGVWSGQFEKEAYAIGLMYAMSDGSIDYAEHVACSNLIPTKALLEDQMRALRRETKQATDSAYNPVKVVFTGKSHNTRDDLVMALQIALHNMRKQIRSDKFLHWAKSQGIDRI